MTPRVFIELALAWATILLAMSCIQLEAAPHWQQPPQGNQQQQQQQQQWGPMAPQGQMYPAYGPVFSYLAPPYAPFGGMPMPPPFPNKQPRIQKPPKNPHKKPHHHNQRSKDGKFQRWNYDANRSANSTGCIDCQMVEQLKAQVAEVQQKLNQVYQALNKATQQPCDTKQPPTNSPTPIVDPNSQQPETRPADLEAPEPESEPKEPAEPTLESFSTQPSVGELGDLQMKPDEHETQTNHLPDQLPIEGAMESHPTASPIEPSQLESEDMITSNADQEVHPQNELHQSLDEAHNEEEPEDQQKMPVPEKTNEPIDNISSIPEQVEHGTLQEAHSPASINGESEQHELISQAPNVPVEFSTTPASVSDSKVGEPQAESSDLSKTIDDTVPAEHPEILENKPSVTADQPRDSPVSPTVDSVQQAENPSLAESNPVNSMNVPSSPTNIPETSHLEPEGSESAMHISTENQNQLQSGGSAEPIHHTEDIVTSTSPKVIGESRDEEAGKISLADSQNGVPSESNETGASPEASNLTDSDDDDTDLPVQMKTAAPPAARDSSAQDSKVVNNMNNNDKDDDDNEDEELPFTGQKMRRAALGRSRSFSHQSKEQQQASSSNEWNSSLNSPIETNFKPRTQSEEKVSPSLKGSNEEPKQGLAADYSSYSSGSATSGGVSSSFDQKPGNMGKQALGQVTASARVTLPPQPNSQQQPQQTTSFQQTQLLTTQLPTQYQYNAANVATATKHHHHHFRESVQRGMSKLREAAHSNRIVNAFVEKSRNHGRPIAREAYHQAGDVFNSIYKGVHLRNQQRQLERLHSSAPLPAMAPIVQRGVPDMLGQYPNVPPPLDLPALPAMPVLSASSFGQPAFGSASGSVNVVRTSSGPTFRRSSSFSSSSSSSKSSNVFG